jgi:hypothetical protein
MPEVIVEVRGGNIVEVYGRPQDTRVTIVDWDNFDPSDIRASIETRPCTPYCRIPRDTGLLILTVEKGRKL